jgi:hypothetical protein
MRSKNVELESIQEPDKIWVTVECTFNLGNYENVKISSGYSRTITEEDDPAELRKEMMDELFSEVDKKGKRIKKDKKNE